MRGCAARAPSDRPGDAARPFIRPQISRGSGGWPPVRGRPRAQGMRSLHPVPLTAEAFAPFGEVLEAAGAFHLINAGLCRRHHDLARLDFGGGRAGISVFHAQPRALPHDLDLIECHPLGSQAFLPMTAHPFLVIVAPGPDAMPLAFRTDGAQGINLRRGTWHGVLTPLHAPGLFAVIDRIAPEGEAPGANLIEHRLPAPLRIEAP